LSGVREICDKYGILLIADEVMSGFGRTGRWFAVEHWGVAPDMITMAKGLTSAYAPLGAVAMKEEIAHSFDERPFVGGLTYNGHPISLAAAIANIGVMQSDGLIEKAEKTGIVMAEMLSELVERHPSVGDVRSIGLMGAVEVVRDQRTREPMAPYNGSSPEMNALRQYLLEHGIYAYIHWNVLLLMPPLIITEAQLAEAFEVLERALALTDAAVK
jgi:taurine--2-oxoglutarate transaminase